MDAYQTALRSNIGKLYALSLTNGGAYFALPIFVVFYQAHDLSLSQIFLIQAIFSIGLIVLEIPSGYVSDRFGRKPTVIISTLFWFLGYLVYALSGTFGGFVCAELLIAVGVSFLSGTEEALTYDTLLELKQEGRYRRIVGQQSFFRFAGESLSSILGGFMALVSLRMPFIATLPLLGAGILIALALEEPKRHRIQETQHLKKMWDICAHTLFRHAPLRGITIIHALASSMTLLLFWLSQPFQLVVGVPLALFGVIHGAIVLSGALASKATHVLQRWMDDRLFLLGITVAVVGSYLGLGYVTTVGGLSFFFIGRIAWGFLTPLTSDLLNRMTSSDVRATTLSIRAFLSRIIFALTAPFIGTLVDRADIPEAMLIVGLIGGGLLGIMFLLMRPVWNRIPA